MPSHSLAVLNEDPGCFSSTASRFADDESDHDGPGKLSSLSFLTPLSEHKPSLPVSLTAPSYSRVDLPFPHYQLSSPTSLFQFPSAEDISPFCSSPVILRVGGSRSPSPETEPLSFLVHSKLLTTASAFFRSALSSYRSSSHEPSGLPTYGFLEAQTSTIDLPEERPDDVRFFLQWLYQSYSLGIFPNRSHDVTSSAKEPSSPHQHDNTAGTTTCPNTEVNSLLRRAALLAPLPVISRQLHLCRVYNRERRRLLPAAKRHRNDVVGPLPLPKPGPPGFGPLIRLYVFADKYGVELGLRDLICDVVREVAEEANAVPNHQDVELLWENTLPHRPRGGHPHGLQVGGLRRLVLDLYAGMKTDKLLAHEDGWHVGFLRDLVAWIRGEWKEGRRRETDGQMEIRPGSGSVKVGPLLRSSCYYHHHHQHLLV